MKDHYVTATTELLLAEENPEKVFEGLAVVLKQRGHMRLQAAILRAVERIVSSKKPDSVATVTVANTTAAKDLKSEIKTALNDLNAVDTPIIKTDPSIIGGFIAATKTAVFDASYKNKLVTLYRDITK